MVSQCMMKLEGVRDLVQLRTFFATKEHRPRFLYVLPTARPQEKCLFFYTSVTGLDQPLFIYYYSFATVPSENVQAVKYSERRGTVEFTDTTAEESFVTYLPLFGLEKFTYSDVSFKDSEEFSFDEETDCSYLTYLQGDGLREIARIAVVLENIVLVLHYADTYVYFTGFPFPLFPVRTEEIFKSPVLWVEGPAPRDEGGAPRFMGVNGHNIDFLEGRESGRNTVPLLSVQRFPFKGPAI